MPRYFKTKMIKHLHDSIVRHEKMMLDDIRSELLAALDRNRQILKNNEKLTPFVTPVFMQGMLQKLDRSEQIIEELLPKCQEILLLLRKDHL